MSQSPPPRTSGSLHDYFTRTPQSATSNATKPTPTATAASPPAAPATATPLLVLSTASPTIPSPSPAPSQPSQPSPAPPLSGTPSTTSTSTRPPTSTSPSHPPSGPSTCSKLVCTRRRSGTLLWRWGRCMATLRSHHFPALLHLNNGINLLLELQSPLPAKSALVYPKTPYTPLPTLHTLLTRLDTQATQLLPSRQTRLRPVSVPPPHYETFTSLEEAKGASDELWNYCLYSLQPESQSSSPALHQYHLQPSLSTQQQQLSPSPTHSDLARLQESYTTALSAFLTTYPPRTPREQQAASILRLHALVATLSLSPASLSSSEEVWEAHTGEFAAIVALARGIIEADNDTGGTGMGRVSMDTGILGPLYLVALRCRDPVLRREAVQLLSLAPRREGLWDSTLLARVAERVVGIEEDSNKAEGGGRISDVDVVFDPEGCRAGVRFLMEGGGVAVT
ncbi:hypothetical protein V502_00825 [Pseudogymnoascus sp. VKM F-4520 (FW-2644)]|nr:hypothetical protein V502_00825 [Pseudogymnoascus sp. VKM F-4520 (FW-2644)]